MPLHPRARALPARRRRPDPPAPLTRRIPLGPALALGAALGLLLLGLAAAQTGAVRDLLDDAGLGPPAEPYTALAFARPASLPERAPAAGGSLPISFAIDNAEGTDRLYAWRITVDAGGGPEVVSHGRASVGDGATETVSTRVPVTCAGARVRLGVVIDAPPRRIGTWLACPGEGTP